MSEVESQVMAEFSFGREDGARGDTDAFAKCLLMQQQCIDFGWQLQPEEITPLRPGQFRSGREVSLDGLNECDLLRGKPIPQMAEMVFVAAMLEVVSNGNLNRDGCCQTQREFLPLDIARITSGCDPAETVAWRKAL